MFSDDQNIITEGKKKTESRKASNNKGKKNLNFLHNRIRTRRVEETLKKTQSMKQYYLVSHRTKASNKLITNNIVTNN